MLAWTHLLLLLLRVQDEDGRPLQGRHLGLYGKANAIGYDTNGDGRVDALDTTGDGNIDTLLQA